MTKKESTKHRDTANKNATEAPALADIVLKRKQDIVNIYKEGTVIPKKLQPKWVGPYRVLRKLADRTYQIQLLGTTTVEQAHRRNLKAYTVRESLSAPLQPVETQDKVKDTPEVFEVHKVVEHKLTIEGIWYKVRWKGYTAKNDTWESHDNLTGDAMSAVNDYLQTLLLEKPTGKTGKK